MDSNENTLLHHQVEHRSDTFTRWMLTVCSSLLAAGVIALWQMANHVEQLDERMAGWTRSMTEQITALHNADVETNKRMNELDRDGTRALSRAEQRIEDILRRLSLIEKNGKP